MVFQNPLGLFALALLVPFIIIYLIRPHPRDMTIPSLMFILKEHQSFKQNSFLQKLLRNLLFILQLIALASLAFSVAAPFFEVPYSVGSDNTILIIDTSGSMQTRSGTATRFDKALSHAKGALSGRVSIIAAGNIPVTLLKQGTSIEAQTILQKMSVKATSTNLGDALLFAEDILEEKKGRIVVISDFLQTEGSTDLLVAKRALIAKGNEVDFIDVSGEAKNVGIVDMELTKQNARVFIKHYNKADEDIVQQTVKNGTASGEHEVHLLPNSIESISFETQTDISSVEIEPSDDLVLDNVLYISAPSTKKIKVLLITSKSKSSLIAALESSDSVDLSVSHPPLEHMVDSTQIAFNDFEIIILSDVGREGEREGLLRGRIKQLQNYVEDGGTLIIAAQTDLMALATTDSSKIAFDSILPVTIDGLGNRTRVCFKMFNQFTSQFQGNECPTVMDNYLRAQAKEQTVVIAEANDGSPILAQQGNVFYYGIIDDKSDFNSLSSYPIFWDDLINFLVRTEDIGDYNFRGGDILTVPQQTVKTPSASIETSKLLLDEHGIYELVSRKIAVNLLNEKESDISQASEDIEQDKSFTQGGEVKKKKIEVEVILTSLVLVLLFIEIFYLKQRGDL